MEKYIINGGRPLVGNVSIQGSKNSAVAVIIACICVHGVVEIDNLPQISDVWDCLYILKLLGAKVDYINEQKVRIDATEMQLYDVPTEVQKRMRASSYLMGAELTRFGYSETAFPGGCDFGGRPINLHIDALCALGADCTIKNEKLIFECQQLTATIIDFPIVTVGGTINAIIAASCAKGTTVIKNAAREPHVADLVNFLNKCGANIHGIGSNEITIYGVESLHGCEFSISSDMIEAGTFMIMGLATNGKIRCENIQTDHLSLFTNVLCCCGATVKKEADSITVYSNKQLSGCYIKTQPFPGFPTDLHPLLTVLLSQASTESIVEETIFNYRFKYLEPLKKMGVDAKTYGNILRISSNCTINSADIEATDLRGGAALLTAALVAHGTTSISSINYIERGYSFILEKLISLGADIRKSSDATLTYKISNKIG